MHSKGKVKGEKRILGVVGLGGEYFWLLKMVRTVKLVEIGYLERSGIVMAKKRILARDDGADREIGRDQVFRAFSFDRMGVHRSSVLVLPSSTGTSGRERQTLRSKEARSSLPRLSSGPLLDSCTPVGPRLGQKAREKRESLKEKLLLSLTEIKAPHRNRQ